MKKLLLSAALLAAFTTSKAQAFANFRLGSGVDPKKQILVSAGLGAQVNRFYFQSDLYIIYQDDQPVILGPRAGYGININNITIQPGFGYYLHLYTTDKNNSVYKNSWAPGYALKLQYNCIFVEVLNTKQTFFSFGVHLKL